MAIVEAVKRWAHLLQRKKFLLITDQAGVKFTFDQTHTSKIKNTKIQNWRIELSEFRFDIQHRPGKSNAAPDALSRSKEDTKPELALLLASAEGGEKHLHQLCHLYETLCCPGVQRLYHLVKQRCLPFTVEECRRVRNACPTCKKVRPQFLQRETSQLVKATQPLERISVGFKGPLPTSSRGNKHLLIVVDEFTRFPWAFATLGQSASSFVRVIREFIATYGAPCYIHSDQGGVFQAAETKTF